MLSPSERKSLLIVLSVFVFVVVSTWGITLLARGYRPSLQPGGLTLNPTGLLSATSHPKGASVYVNNSLITATDDTINLTPGSYLVKIVKDGYFSWQKNIQIKPEVVYQTDSQLFRSTPDLRPLTHTGIINPQISPDFSKIIFAVASSSATANNGLYLIELSANPLYLSKNTPRQIALNTSSIDWSKATFEFSPNSLEVIATLKSNLHYHLNLASTIDTKTLTDVTSQLDAIRQEWSNQLAEVTQAKLDRLPPQLAEYIATDSGKTILLNTLDDKVVYQAKDSLYLKNLLASPPPAQSTQAQSRQLIKNDYYIYDIKDDTNFYLGPEATIRLPFWLPNSNNIVYQSNHQIKAVDYDATNSVTLFAGDFSPDTVMPWFDGNRIVALITPYLGAITNLYTITIH